MANITSEHLHHMARRHHATMQKLDGLQATIKTYAQKSYGLLETGGGAWLGGLIEGKFGGAALGPLPYNLLAGVGFLVAANMKVGGDTYAKHFENLGNGLVASYTSALGYSFGKRWRETGKAFGGGGSPWLSPYENGWPKPPLAAASAPTAAGQWPTSDPTPAQMAAIAQQMQAAANSPAY
jgi:hypothetical protein